MALLTELAIRNWKPTKSRETKPCGGREGLYIRASSSGKKSFYWRKGSFYKLGDYPALTLSQARSMAVICNQRVRQGLSPEDVLAKLRMSDDLVELATQDADEIRAASKSLVRSKAVANSQPTYERAFQEFYKAYAETNLQAGPSRNQPLSLHRDHVPAELKAKPMNEIRRADIFPWMLALLRDKHETGRRLRNQLERVFEFAINCGYCEANPVPNRRAFEIKKPKTNSHGTLDYSRLPELWAWLDTRSFLPQTKLAIRLLVLSAHRVSVVLAARWEHLDLETGIWTVPAKTDNETSGLMKSGRMHITTLPMPFIEELKQLKGTSPFTFPSATGRGHVTQNALLKALKEFDETITAHGFRNTFKTWARSEGIPDWIADAYVDHSLKGLDASYRREDPARVEAECAKVTERLYGYVGR
ncbi:XerC Integrase [Sphingomonadaceae bacterium]